ncbi:hypothetical protein RchiOBHm_Chr1g0367781 [Rosa chinensis]|uniref:Uncharacterized protein n=1 Tax=Rosa chinensis TaxID=74649 RepID=A0A2P6SKJ6_ROSCH|nr:hypothetical protein RchiOBHm_Chr1g0367781 [Rosa chinensis]
MGIHRRRVICPVLSTGSISHFLNFTDFFFFGVQKLLVIFLTLKFCFLIFCWHVKMLWGLSIFSHC